MKRFLRSLPLLAALCLLPSVAAAESVPAERPAKNIVAKESKAVKSAVIPELWLHGNMGTYNTLQLATIAASGRTTQTAKVDGRPLLVMIRDEKTFNKLWTLFGSSVLAAEPVNKPKIDFDKQGAVFVVPYETRGGGKPPTLRGIRFDEKKQHLVMEFDESDIFKKNADTTGQMVTSVMGNPWYFAVFPEQYLHKQALVRVRDW